MQRCSEKITCVKTDQYKMKRTERNILMKKTLKKAALLLSLAMMISTLSVATFAADPTGEAGVDYTKGELVPVDPEKPIDPDEPGGPTVGGELGISGSSFYFGEHAFSPLAQTLPSVVRTSGPAAGTGEKLGLAVSSGDTTITSDWELTAKIGPFKLGTEDNISDFTIALTAGTVAKRGELNMTAINATLDPDPAEAPVRIFQGNGLGLAGCDFTGVLKIPAGGVKKAGVSSAVIVWKAGAIV